MSNFRFAIETKKVPPGHAVSVELDGYWYTISNDGGTFYATDEACPHEGGHLGGGEVRDGCLICPVHCWPWNLQTGLSDTHMPWLRLKRYRCEVRENRIYVDISSHIPLE